MSYITEAEYKKMFSEDNFTNYIQGTLDAGAEATARFDFYCDMVDDIIDSKINMRYDIEDISTTPLLKFIAGSMIQFFAGKAMSGTINDTVQTLYDEAKELLDKLRSAEAEIIEDKEIIDEYFSKRIIAAGGNSDGWKAVEHIKNKY